MLYYHLFNFLRSQQSVSLFFFRKLKSTASVWPAKVWAPFHRHRYFHDDWSQFNLWPPRWSPPAGPCRLERNTCTNSWNRWNHSQPCNPARSPRTAASLHLKLLHPLLFLHVHVAHPAWNLPQSHGFLSRTGRDAESWTSWFRPAFSVPPVFICCSYFANAPICVASRCALKAFQARYWFFSPSIFFKPIFHLHQALIWFFHIFALFQSHLHYIKPLLLICAHFSLLYLLSYFIYYSEVFFFPWVI